MRHGGRHAPHGRQLLGADAGLELAQVLQEHHAEAFRALVHRRRQAGADAHLACRAAGLGDGQLGRPALAPLEGLRRQLRQGAPGRVAVEREGDGHGGEAVAQDQVRRRVDGMHAAVDVHHQHALAQRLDHQFVDLGVHLRRGPAAGGQHLLAGQPQCQLVCEQRHHEKPGAREGGLQVARRRVDTGTQRVVQRIGQQQQRDRGRGGQAHRQRTHHRAHQHRQGEQRGEVDAARLQQLQQREGGQVDADRADPCQSQAAQRRLRIQHARAEQDEGEIGDRDGHRHRLEGLPEAVGDPLEQQQHHPHEHAGRHEAAPQARQAGAARRRRDVQAGPVGGRGAARPEQGHGGAQSSAAWRWAGVQ